MDFIQQIDFVLAYVCTVVEQKRILLDWDL